MIDRLRLVAALVEQLDTPKHESPLHSAGEAWVGEWKSRCHMLNSRITARAGGEIIIGLVTDIDPLHGLVIREDNGSTRFLSAQTTTLSSV